MKQGDKARLAKMLGLDSMMDDDMDDMGMPFGIPGMGTGGHGHGSRDILSEILGAALTLRAMGNKNSEEEMVLGHDCDACHESGHCPIEGIMRKKRDEIMEKTLDVENLKNAEHIATDAEIVGKKAEIKFLKDSVISLRSTIDEHAKRHKAEVEQLTDKYKIELDRARELYNSEIKGYEERFIHDRKQIGQMSRDLRSTTKQLDAVQAILSQANGTAPEALVQQLNEMLGIALPAPATEETITEIPAETGAATDESQA